MKTKILLLLVLIIVIGCKKEEQEYKQSPIIGKWECNGFGEINEKGETLFREIIKPRESEQNNFEYYTIEFNKKDWISNTSLFVSTIGGDKIMYFYIYKDNFLSFNLYSPYVRSPAYATNDPQEYYDILSEMSHNKKRVQIESDILKIFYTQNKYLLFKKTK